MEITFFTGYIDTDIFIEIFEAKFQGNSTLYRTQMSQVISGEIFLEIIYFASFDRTIYIDIVWQNENETPCI